MEKVKTIHVGLRPPSCYPQLLRSGFKEVQQVIGNDLKSDSNDVKSHKTTNVETSKFNITVGKFNPKTTRFGQMNQNLGSKMSSFNQISKRSSIKSGSDFNFDELSSLSSYDFSKLGSNSTNKSVLSSSDGKKSIRFSIDNLSSSDSFKLGQIRSLDYSKKSSDTINQGFERLQSDSGVDPKNFSGSVGGNRSEYLLDELRKVVKHVINVNRIRNQGSDFMSNFIGVNSQGIENVGFSDDPKNKTSSNPSRSFENVPLINKGTTTSLFETQINSPNPVDRNVLNRNFNRKLLKIKEKYSKIDSLLQDLGDPLKLINDDQPISNIIEDHVNTKLLVHPLHINYYPKKVEEEDEEDYEEVEYELLRKKDPIPEKKVTTRPEDYPSLWAVRLKLFNQY
ncbi:uncharacterized protein TA10325 [Theileria annulata]|uniref:Uncharacterized protein n=1 Tax=Theileria annulata TaxID=5874 RepID=Q4U8W9_THEAN|nr:uncharacterized protein TA10325 [Theileria annulata]CAI76734.1 hypothetical protein TA10325 [Theileria annulata]|eukprot:XP_953359.1 hypothetical protein TA10325 [Theileria annulata]